MNNPELEALLKKARLPEISQESLEMFPRRVADRLRHDPAPPRPARSFLTRPAWAAGLATICILLAFSIGHWRGRKETQTMASSDILASTKFAGETLAMFPNQVRAIVENESGLHLVLSEHDNLPASPPLYIRICDGDHCSSFVTFSGQEIQMAGQAVTVLSDAHGGIILAGDQFVWSNAERSPVVNHLKIQAKILGAAAM